MPSMLDDAYRLHASYGEYEKIAVPIVASQLSSLRCFLSLSDCGWRHARKHELSFDDGYSSTAMQQIAARSSPHFLMLFAGVIVNTAADIHAQMAFRDFRCQHSTRLSLSVFGILRRLIRSRASHAISRFFAHATWVSAPQLPARPP